MSGVYIVSFMDSKWNEYSNWAFAGFQSAKEKVLKLSETILLRNPTVEMNKDPDQEGFDNPRWFFIDEDNMFLIITFLKVEGFISNNSYAPNKPDWNDYSKDLPEPINKSMVSIPNNSVSTAEEVIEIMGRHVPAGFSISNKPLTNEHLLKYPYQFKSKSELTEKQKFALAVARLKKASHYKIRIYGQIMENTEALSYLEAKDRDDSISSDIMDSVLDDIELLREKRANEMSRD